ncbi:V-set and immunoglobulin domain-containing protein 10-like 2 [Salmo salar]|uniref:V-set and immunoglobulin domain-containing protein 10-like 2 n=1 Tax=Salmo trutta TaxID=8032 RepID=UPI00113030E0|nr:V-set and immunoglobulin domain-containing protein 10-like 2 [Salmo trutta]XP_045580890.1 V-set and immunoglobulin domain-containing protein 10-like 2 [Salmo salar]
METLRRMSSLCLFLCLLQPPLQGLEIVDPEEVEYIRQEARGVVGGSVTLECGSTMPDILIWGFTRPGSQSNLAVAYNYGHGPMLQPLLSSSLGHLKLMPNTSSLLLDELHHEAQGMYTCQAIYNTDRGATITFYYTQLEVVEED